MTQKQRLGFPQKSWLMQAYSGKSRKPSTLTVLGSADAKKDWLASVKPAKWIKDEISADEGKLHTLIGDKGPLWVLTLPATDDSHYQWCRDQGNALFSAIKKATTEALAIDFHDCTEGTELGVFVGLEMAQYSFKATRGIGKTSIPALSHKDLDKEVLTRAAEIAHSVNLARHLVNLPAGDLNPKTYVSLIKEVFKGSKTTTIEVYDAERLKKEKAGMILAVGQGADTPSCLVRIKYRPKKVGKCGKQPVAFVGKGVTFDTGGLDMKPSQFMRNMKKDMGGSASVLGLAHWAEQRKIEINCDFWLGIAENAVSAKSFRPGDILTARNGLQVEIHNTDAEGRLVLGDALHIAATHKDKPRYIVDLATLTGAMRVALGTKIAGLFANDDQLAEKIGFSAESMGDPTWRMPLEQSYADLINSSVADMTNAASVPFGGGITAALFLERFVEGLPWVHVDMYAWTDRTGPFAESGGNGQLVQGLAHFLEMEASGAFAEMTETED